MIEFKSEENIKQAWLKVKNWALYPKADKWLPRTTQYIDPFHKREVLEFNLQENRRLEFLIEKIQCDTFEPVAGDIYWIPKSNYGLRPMVVISCDDLIYYQAIINVLVEIFKEEFSLLSNRYIYGNIPSDYKSLRIIYPFLDQYKKFLKQVSFKQNEGFIVGESDITSFYTEISYSILRSILSTKFLEVNVNDSSIIDKLIFGLGTWFNPSHNKLNKIKGIPQGIPQSHILANIFLFALDENLRKDVDYIRYVDDFRIFASTEATISKGFLRLDSCLQEIGLLKKDSKTYISKKYEFDPFENFYNKMNDLISETISETKTLSFINFESLFSFNISPGILDSFDLDEIDSEELDEKEDFEEEIFKKLSKKEEEEKEFEDEKDLPTHTNNLNLIYKVPEDKLLGFCENSIQEALQNIYSDEELNKNYPELKRFVKITSNKTVDFNPVIVEQYLRLIVHIYRWVLPKRKLTSDFTNYIALQNCENNQWEISNYVPFFHEVLKNKKLDQKIVNGLLDWLVKQLDYKNPFDTIKYHSLEILASDIEARRKSDIAENALFYLGESSVNWYLKLKAFEISLRIQQLSLNSTAVQNCLEHFNDSNNSRSSKLVLAQEILNYHKVSKFINYDVIIRSLELKKLIQLSANDIYTSLNYFAFRTNNSLVEKITLEKKSKIFKEYINELSYNCAIRFYFEKYFSITFMDKFSFRDIYIKNKNHKLQPNYKSTVSQLEKAIENKNNGQYESYVNNIIGVIEALLYTLYAKIDLDKDGERITGFSTHRPILAILYPEQDWGRIIQNLAKIRNTNPISHIRDRFTLNFNYELKEEEVIAFDENLFIALEYLIDNLNSEKVDKLAQAKAYLGKSLKQKSNDQNS